MIGGTTVGISFPAFTYIVSTKPPSVMRDVNVWLQCNYLLFFCLGGALAATPNTPIVPPTSILVPLA